MRISDDDADRFVKLYAKLMFFAGTQRNILPTQMTFKIFLAGPIEEKLDCRQAIYQPRPIFDDFLLAGKGKLSVEDQILVTTWKHSIYAPLVMFRHLKKNTVFISTTASPVAYGVLGLSAELGDIIPSAHLPVLVKTALLPFEDVIVCDGLIATPKDGMTMDSAMRDRVNLAYKELKAANKFVTRL